MNFIGDFNTGSTVYVYLTTNTAMGVPVAPSSAFEAADFILYKNGSATQRTSQAGWTITSPFDSVTGLHVLAIDLSDNTDSGFYAAGSTYTLLLSPDETVDGLAVAAVVAQFSIERVTKVNVTQVGGTSQTARDIGAGIPAATPGASGGLLIVGANAAAVSFTGGLTITNASGAAVLVGSLGANGSGLTVFGNGSGHGITASGGTTGHGLNLLGGVTSGHGLLATAQTSGDGVNIAGGGTSGHGMKLTRGGASGDDLLLTNSDFALLPSALTAGGNMKSDSLAISGDTTAADNLESAFDGTGYIDKDNINGRRWWYISAASGNDSNSGLLPGAAFATFNAAQDAASPGDEIAFTDSYTSKVSVTKSGLTLTSAGGSVSYSGSDNTSTNAGAVFVGSGVNYTTLLNLNISGTDATDGTGVRFGDASDTTTYSYGNAIIGCKLAGKYDCVYMHLQRGLRIENVHAPGTFDGGYFYKTQARCINSIFYTDGSYSTAHAHRGVVCGPECDIEFINCQLEADRSASSTIDIAGFHSVELPITSKRSNFVFRGGTIYANHSHSGSTARVSAIDAQNVAGTRYGYCVELNGTVVKSSNAGAGAVYDIHLPTASMAKVSGPAFLDRTKINLAGTAVIDWPDRDPLRPTTADRTIDVTATGEAGMDWANVGSPTTTLNLSGTTIKTATDVETKIGTPADTLAEDIANVTAVSITDINHEHVPASRCFKFIATSDEGLVGESQKSISSAIATTLAFDFSNDLPLNGRIRTVDAIDVLEGTGLTLSGFGRDHAQAKCRAVATAAGQFTIGVEVTYTTGSKGYGIAVLNVPTAGAVLSGGTPGSSEEIELSDVEQEPIPPPRMFKLVATRSRGLVGESIKSVSLDAEEVTIGVDFSADTASNRGIATVASVQIISGSGSGLTFGTLKRDKAVAKIPVTLVEAGTYELDVAVVYVNGDGARGRITYEVAG